MAASSYSAASHEDSIARINITPLVDVMLVLLVIFMIAAPTLTGTLPMRLPASDPSAKPSPPARHELSIDAGGGFALDGRALTTGALRAELAAIAARSPQSIVEIAASRDADYQAFATALSAARGSGIENVTFQR